MKRLNKKKGHLSYDIMGDIIILNNKISKKEAEALLKERKNAKTILYKTKMHSGKYRTRKLSVITGVKNKTALYKENGCLFKLNVETCYFSSRLSNERLRIAKQVKHGEKILVMFSGVSPYSIVIAKNSKANEIVGIEWNPKAHEFALQNIKLNKVQDRVEAYCGDVRKVVIKLKKKFDRIIMPLPRDADDFLDVALKVLNKKGIIHFYDFEKEEDISSKAIEKIKKYCEPKILNVIKTGKYSPRKYRICVDFCVKKLNKKKKV